VIFVDECAHIPPAGPPLAAACLSATLLSLPTIAPAVPTSRCDVKNFYESISTGPMVADRCRKQQGTLSFIWRLPSAQFIQFIHCFFFSCKLGKSRLLLLELWECPHFCLPVFRFRGSIKSSHRSHKSRHLSRQAFITFISMMSPSRHRNFFRLIVDSPFVRLCRVFSKWELSVRDNKPSRHIIPPDLRPSWGVMMCQTTSFLVVSWDLGHNS